VHPVPETGFDQTREHRNHSAQALFSRGAHPLAQMQFVRVCPIDGERVGFEPLGVDMRFPAGSSPKLFHQVSKAPLITRTTTAAYKPGVFQWAVFGRKRGPFCRKTGVPRKLFCTFFRVFPVFRDFLRRKPLPSNDKPRSDPSKKNHTKNTTVGFLSLPGCAIIAA